MRKHITYNDPPGWYQCRDRLGRIVPRYWNGQVLKNFPDAEWFWQPGTCCDFLGPLLPAGVFAALLPFQVQPRQGVFARLFNWLRRKKV